MKEFTREYFLEELVRFREFMGSRAYWRKVLDGRPTAVGGLFLVLNRSEGITETDEIAFQAAMDEHGRRHLLVVLHGVPQ